MRPGSAPTYVRRCPRISASSRTPPRATRTNFRPERPRDGLAERGLADAGRTDQRQHGAGAAAADDLQAALGATGADGEVLHDPVLHVVEAVVVGVEDLAGARDVGGVLGAHVPRQLEHGVEPGADPAGLGALVARALQLADLAQRGLADLLGQVGGLDAGAVVVGALGLVLAELLADRGELLAQQELALALVHALADVVLDLLGDLELGEVLARPLRAPASAAPRCRGSRAARASARR